MLSLRTPQTSVPNVSTSEYRSLDTGNLRVGNSQAPSSLSPSKHPSQANPSQRTKHFALSQITSNRPGPNQSLEKVLNGAGVKERFIKKSASDKTVPPRAFKISGSQQPRRSNGSADEPLAIPEAERRLFISPKRCITIRHVTTHIINKHKNKFSIDSS